MPANLELMGRPQNLSEKISLLDVRESLAGAAPTCLSHPTPRRWVAGKLQESRGMRLHIARLEQEPGLRMNHGLHDTPTATGHDRQSRSHRFEVANSERFHLSSDWSGSVMSGEDVAPFAEP